MQQMRQMPPQHPRPQNESSWRMYLDSVLKFGMDVGQVTPVIPDTVMDNIMAEAGMHTTDPAVARVLSIACQKYISQILYTLIREKSDSHDPSTANLDDIKQALEKNNIRSCRPDYLVGEMDDEHEEISKFMDFGFQGDHDDLW